MHDPSKVLMGTVKSSFYEATNFAGNVEAGLACHLKSTGEVSIAKSDGALVGISRGLDIPATGVTVVVREGAGVPVQLGDSFTPSKGDAVFIDDTTGKAVATAGGTTAVNAFYSSGKIKGVLENGSEIDVALIDFVGGL